ncbi:MAG: thioredoxin domain-containing protein [candidate division WOR-3 bacterium]|nr:MAG: thioredoxin domain-containing protein [candidate division WOR-3 bacterium]
MNNVKPKVTRNRLANAKSPYLLQHAQNPVDWFPWEDEAFEIAQNENRPVFLSIGYSTCHWCHVMARESFEDREVAKLLNEFFVCIKVDREERPDIDHIYMTVCQLMTGRAGWPLTIIMTPDKQPFFAATYIPKTARFGSIGMMELIPKIKSLWMTQQNQIVNVAQQTINALRKTTVDLPDDDLDRVVLKNAYRALLDSFDEKHGGFGSAPKFPTAHNLLFLLRYWKRNKEEKALAMVEKTLRAMRQGGIYDHVGFGFHRYSTDERWLLPHFEKMLYDQALLSLAYIEAYQATGNQEFGDTAAEIFTYVLRDMTSAEAGFYAAEDADSEGEEGKFYFWTEQEINEILGKDASIFIKLFNINQNGNFVDQAASKKNRNILYLEKTRSSIARDFDISPDEVKSLIEKFRRRLFDARKARVSPHKDDKILTDWNGLMIAALAKGSQALHEPAYAEAAQKATDFILKSLRTRDGHLFHRYRDTEAAIPANLDDYTFFIWGLIELYEATFNINNLETALELNNTMLKHFWDENRGGFYFTPDTGEPLLVRPKQSFDSAMPSGNSVALLNLLRLGRITANHDYAEKAAQMIRAFARRIKQSPLAHTQFLASFDFALGPHSEVVVVGNSHAPDTQKMLGMLGRYFVPNAVILLRPTEEQSPRITRLAPYVEKQKTIDDMATAYVCVNHTCTAPTTDVHTMLGLLNRRLSEEE